MFGVSYEGKDQGKREREMLDKSQMKIFRLARNFEDQTEANL